MRDDYTDITIVLDRSGSMHSIANDVVGGFNKFIDDQRKQPGELRVTLHQFDHRYETVYNAVNVSEVGPLNFQPEGMTALFDAVGRSITSTGERLSRMEEWQRPYKVIFLIITDGLENASREYTKNRIRDMIKHQTDVYSWTFVFMGANQDSFAEAEQIGVAQGNVMNFASNSKGTRSSYDSLSSKLSAVRCKSAGHEVYTSGNFFDAADYQLQAAAGADNTKAPMYMDPSQTTNSTNVDQH